MLPIRPTPQFKRDLKKAKKQGRDLGDIRYVLEQLAASIACWVAGFGMRTSP